MEEDIRVVRSHPMALLQCTNFPGGTRTCRLSQSADTAESARKYAGSDNLVAAIASKAAAALYSLEIVEECI